ncbi:MULTISPECIES: KdsC family phosphatase [Cysteiniphilum]|uniref:3-deoxy-D-manno-octulosonate 8-phosphate phosphatase KdsC n=1 Tax=Cysteiniphilum litorale TaxID=2056700 RepID=A0A8J2Z4E1_9GAMM|nr:MULTISPECIES: HAD-IIIA family hydrolase [Cysteiniphilum]WHN65682.1 HAD-IIIA family hydrolase [Cysteiniphilum sp. QT6929]GGF98245.1 3-deoxy-D-manno-octulosonate 8-phosphate phosphatase [Cysteiniphilum litorale]
MVSSDLKEKIANIQLLILDVDGVLSDGKIILSNDGNLTKNFDVKDGLGMLLLQKFGVKLAVITGKTSQVVQDRLSSLGVNDVYQGQKNKIKAYEDLLKKHQINQENIAYMGDDLPDLTLMMKSAVSFAPADALRAVKTRVDYVTAQKGGYGAVREVCDLILESKGLLDKIVDDYITFGEARL